MTAKTLILTGTILAAVGVVFGAMGAHALKQTLEPSALESFITGTRYQMYHAIALIAIAGVLNHLNTKWVNLGIKLMISGVILFSGSIYILSTKDLSGIQSTTFLGPLTPVGGLLIISGWVSIAISALKKNN